VGYNTYLRVSGVFDFLLCMTQENYGARPHELHPIYISDADEQDAHSIALSFIYESLYFTSSVKFGDFKKKYVWRLFGRISNAIEGLWVGPAPLQSSHAQAALRPKGGWWCVGIFLFPGLLGV
jgi:hypothetical protein